MSRPWLHLRLADRSRQQGACRRRSGGSPQPSPWHRREIASAQRTNRQVRSRSSRRHHNSRLGAQPVNSNDVFPTSPPSSRSVTPGGLASIVLVLVAAIVLLVLLNRTQHNAVQIRKAAADIATSGRGINDSTDSIMQLNR